jgi:hypothetical protein
VLATIRQKVLDPGRIIEPPIWLHDEQAEQAKKQIGKQAAARTLIECSTPHCAVRPKANEFYPFLRGGEPAGVRNLPDYVIFADSPAKSGGAALWVLACELKSSEGGAKSALRQVQLGRLLVDYLVRMARFQAGQQYPSKSDCWAQLAETFCAGMILRPDAPILPLKHSTRSGRMPVPGIYDGQAGMQIYDWRSGDSVRMDDLFF